MVFNWASLVYLDLFLRDLYSYFDYVLCCDYRDYVFYYNRDYALSDSWKFDNALILEFVPLLLMVLYIDISLCSITVSTWYCFLEWSWWFFYWICWCLQYAYHHYMGLNAEEFAVMPFHYFDRILWGKYFSYARSQWAYRGSTLGLVQITLS